MQLLDKVFRPGKIITVPRRSFSRPAFSTCTNHWKKKKRKTRKESPKCNYFVFSKTGRYFFFLGVRELQTNWQKIYIQFTYRNTNTSACNFSSPLCLERIENEWSYNNGKTQCQYLVSRESEYWFFQIKWNKKTYTYSIYTFEACIFYQPSQKRK